LRTLDDRQAVHRAVLVTIEKHLDHRRNTQKEVVDGLAKRVVITDAEFRK